VGELFKRDVEPPKKLDNVFEYLSRSLRAKLNKYFFELLKPYIKKGDVLNIGCGSHSFGNVRLDIYKTTVSNVVGDARFMPFPDEIFDSALALSVLHHIPNYWVAIREIRRVLKKGGTIVGWEPNIFHPYLIALTYQLRLTNERPLYPRHIRRVLEANGLKIIFEDYFFAGRFVYNFIKSWRLVVRLDRYAPKILRGYYAYAALKT